MVATLKAALEDLLRARRLHPDGPPLRGEDRRHRPLATGIAAVDGLLAGGLPRGQVSELYGPPCSGRTGLAFSLVARAQREGALVAWADPGDRLDPASAAAAGVALARLFWLRGETRSARVLTSTVSAVGTLLGSGLFDVVVFDLAGQPADALHRLPVATWIRLQRMIESAPGALVLLADAHVAHGPGGASLRLFAEAPRWTGPPGPGRLLAGLGVQVGGRSGRQVAVVLQAPV